MTILNELIKRIPNKTEVFINSLNRSLLETLVSPIANSFGDNIVAANVLREISMVPAEVYYLWNGTELGSTGIVRDLAMSSSQFFKSSVKPIMIYSLSSELGFGKLIEAGRYANYIIDPIAKIPAVISIAKQSDPIAQQIGYYEFLTAHFQPEWILTGMIGGLTGVIASEVIMLYLITPLNINTAIREGVNYLQNLSLENYLLFKEYQGETPNFDSKMNLPQKLSLIPDNLSYFYEDKIILTAFEFSKYFITHSVNYIVAGPLVRSAFDMVVNPLLKNQVLITDLTNTASKLIKTSILTALPFIAYASYEYYNDNEEHIYEIFQETAGLTINSIAYTIIAPMPVGMIAAVISNPVTNNIKDYFENSDYMLGQTLYYALDFAQNTVNIPINSLKYVYEQFTEYNEMSTKASYLGNALTALKLNNALSKLYDEINGSSEEGINKTQKLTQIIIDKSSHKLDVPMISFYQPKTDIIAESIFYEKLTKADDVNWGDYLFSFFKCYSAEEMLDYNIKNNQIDDEKAVIKFNVVNKKNGICERHAHVIDDSFELNRTEFVTDDYAKCFE